MTLTRRKFAAACGALATAPPAWCADTARAAAEGARAEITKRFLDPLGTVYHYVGLQGEVIRPTAAECSANKPSAMSWSTPIEDGPFFGALYLDGLIQRWRALKTPKSAADARRIAEGLIRLGGHSAVDGFITRGICADGRAHYSASSEDQAFPWFYGLWQYLRSGLATADERDTIKALIVRHGRAIEGHGWRIPCSPPEFGYRGSYVRPTAYDSARLLCVHRILHDVTADPHWLEGYERYVVERPEKSSARTRLELCAAGIEFGFIDPGETRFWTTSMGVAALRVLRDTDPDRARRAAFEKGLLASAAQAATHISRFRNYDPSSRMHFDIDWRFLNDSWKPQANCDESFLLARNLLPLWAKKNPRSIYEDQTMREPLFAAWIVTLTADRSLVSRHRDEIRQALTRYRWTDLYTSTFFVAVNVYYQGAQSGL